LSKKEDSSAIQVIFAYPDNYINMKKIKMMRLLSLAFLLITVFMVSCSDTENTVAAPVPNIAQIVSQSPNFSTLNAAVAKAGLADALATTQH
jgi:uncharacterized surface protein with fasciclin (FAS1) repeats